MFKLDDRFLSRNALRIRWIKLAIFCAPLLGAYFYSHTSYSSPFFCPFRVVTGIPCPTCGMTRSFMAIAQGDLAKAVSYNLFGPFLFLGFLIATIHLVLEVTTERGLTAFYTQLIKNKKLQLLALVSLLIYHSIRLYHLSNSGELAINFNHSPLGKLLL